jgi:ubiquinone/menaquinone biosynthesis C-methylase UbiE
MNDYFKTFEARGHLYNDAMSICPNARNAERRALLDPLCIEPGQTVMDAPAGGGYVADGVNESVNGSVDIVCVEPSPKFASAIQAKYTVHTSPLNKVPMEAESVDSIVSLAGLHHAPDRKSIYKEWNRLLKPNGIISVGDVKSGTPTGEFLNTFVDQHTDEGHKGIFFESRELTREFTALGLNVQSENLIDVPWVFPNLDTLGEFCKSLFGITGVSKGEVVEALADTIGIKRVNDGKVSLLWQLQYAVSRKAINKMMKMDD